MSSHMTPGLYQSQMQGYMTRVRSQMAAIAPEKDPTKRDTLLREHYQGMYRDKQTMRGMGCRVGNASYSQGSRLTEDRSARTPPPQTAVTGTPSKSTFRPAAFRRCDRQLRVDPGRTARPAVLWGRSKGQSFDPLRKDGCRPCGWTRLKKPERLDWTGFSRGNSPRIRNSRR